MKNTTEESAVSNDILKLPGGILEVDKPFKVIKQYMKLIVISCIQMYGNIDPV